MLAQNFKSPAQLGIPSKDFDALLTVLGMLEREELVLEAPYRPAVPNGFNMATVETEKACGTVCCILGWARRFNRQFEIPDWNSPMFDLFTGGGRNIGYLDQITPAQAAVALRNYLTHGEPRWQEAMETA